MKKLLAVSIIVILYLSPLAAFAQRRNAEQTKPGRYQADYKYDAVDDVKEINSEDSNYKSFSGHRTTTVHAQFQSSQFVKVRHTNFTSVFDNLTPQGGGSCSITYSGEEHHVSKDDLRYDETEQSAFSGTVTEAGGIGMNFADSGDTADSADAGANGTGSGFYKKMSQSESWVYNPNTIKNVKTMMPPEIDTNCNQGSAETGLVTGGVSGDADSTKPPETACSGTFQIGANIFTRSRNADDANDGRFFGEAIFKGGFAAGKYTMSLTTTGKPADHNRTQDGLTETMTETLTFSVNLTIGGAATSAISAPAQSFDSSYMTEILLPDDKLRLSFRQSKV